MGKNKALIFLVAALGLALVTSFFIYRWLQKTTAEKPVVVQQKTVTAVVAATDLSPGTRLTEEMLGTHLRTAEFLEKTLPPGILVSVDLAKNKTILVPVQANELLLESKLTEETLVIGGMASLLPAGKRAFTIRVDKVSSVAGFILPGDRVDVLLTATGEDERISKFVLNNLLVLSTSSKLPTPIPEDTGDDKKKEEDKVHIPDVITLEVTPEQAEKLAIASSEGKILLALRGTADEEDIHTSGESLMSVLDGVTSSPRDEYEDDEEAMSRPQVKRKRKPRVFVEVLDGTTPSRRVF